MLDHPVTARLQQAFESLPAVPDVPTRAVLKSHVHAFVDACKENGAPVERCIIAIKQVAAAAGIRSSVDMTSERSRLTAADAILLDVIRWTVERYFDYRRPRQKGALDVQPDKRSRGGGQQMASYRSLATLGMTAPIRNYSCSPSPSSRPS